MNKYLTRVRPSALVLGINFSDITPSLGYFVYYVPITHTYTHRILVDL